MPFSQVASARIVTNLPGSSPLDAFGVGDISSQSLTLVLPHPLAAEQEVWVELTHPILEAPLRLPARVQWCRMQSGDPRPHAGLEFALLQPLQRMGLRLVQAAEVGCRVVAGERTAGFVVTHGEGSWSLYDAQTVKVANLSQSGLSFEVTFFGERPEDSTVTLDANTLPDAIRIALELDRPPLVLPAETGQWFPLPLDLPDSPAPAPNQSAAPRPAARAYHTVLSNGEAVGYVAITSVQDEWSLYDPSWNEQAVVSPFAGSFKVTILGGTMSGSRGAEESLEYFMARDFLGAVSLAFGLEHDATLDPPLAEVPDSGTYEALPAGLPSDDDEAPLAADQPHHCVFEGGDLIGYVARYPGRADVWVLYNTLREQLAKTLSEGGRIKLVFVGGDPNDSLEYMVARNLKGAIALAFELDHEPRLDPELPLDT